MPRAGTVIFDCDSTLTSIEGIEELARDHRDEVARLTDAAMRGDVPLEDVYRRRLALIRPTRTQVDALGGRYIETLVPDALRVVTRLRAAGVDVRILSGGVRQAVCALARALGIDEEHVAAVSLYFAADGSYAGFDERSPLARSGGKREAIEQWGVELARPIVLVGDGATDLEARVAVDRFIAYAGVVERAAVVAAADDVIRTPSLAPLLALVLDNE